MGTSITRDQILGGSDWGVCGYSTKDEAYSFSPSSLSPPASSSSSTASLCRLQQRSSHRCIDRCDKHPSFVQLEATYFGATGSTVHHIESSLSPRRVSLHLPFLPHLGHLDNAHLRRVSQSSTNSNVGASGLDLLVLQDENRCVATYLPPVSHTRHRNIDPSITLIILSPPIQTFQSHQ